MKSGSATISSSLRPSEEDLEQRPSEEDLEHLRKRVLSLPLERLELFRVRVVLKPGKARRLRGPSKVEVDNNKVSITFKDGLFDNPEEFDYLEILDDLGNVLAVHNRSVVHFQPGDA